MNKKIYDSLILWLILLFFSILLSNQYIDYYNYKKHTERMYDEVKNYIITETESDSIRLNMEIELTSYNNNTCMLKDVVHPDTMYLILIIPMSYWEFWTGEAAI